MNVTETTLSVDNLNWYFRETKLTNNQPPVILLHGIPAHSYTWREILPELAKEGFLAIAPDWIGFGSSAKPNSRDFAYTPDAYLQAFTAFCNTFNFDKFSLVIQGFLATVGIQYALTHPENIHRMVILNTPITTNAKLPWSLKQWTIPLLGEMLTQDPLLVDRTLETGSGFVIQEEDLGKYREPFLKNSAAGRSLLNVTKNLQLNKSTSQIESELANWNKPTMILWGMADPWLSSTVIETLAQNNNNLEFRKLPEAKHYPQEHWCSDITPKIINFLKRESV